jgi:hypothetical protein
MLVTASDSPHGRVISHMTYSAREAVVAPSCPYVIQEGGPMRGTEHASDAGPGGMQDLIGRPSWDDTLVRADVRDFVAAQLVHPDGVAAGRRDW